MEDRDVKEFSTIITKLVEKGSCNEVSVFKGCFQVFISENLFTFPKPLGDLFKKGIIVCGYKEDPKCNTVSSSGSYDSSDLSSTGNELDITGTPLECVFDYSLLEELSPKAPNGFLKSPKIANSFYPLSVVDAKYVIELCNLSLVNVVEEIPLFLICDKQDPDNTALMGIYRKVKNSRLVVYCKGPYSKKDDTPTFQSIKMTHKKYYNSSLEITAYAHYDIKDSLSTPNQGSLKPCKDGSLAVKCSWSNVTELLQTPSADATCELFVKTVSGDESTGVHARFTELTLLQSLKNSLVTGKVVWPNTSKDPSLFSKLMNLINGETEIGIRQMHQKNEFFTNSSDFASSFEASVTENRKDMDFTDHLWTILSDCTSYSELVEALEFVFKKMKNAPITPVIYRKNTTAVAKLIRDIKESSTLPSLESTTPIKLLLEIGVQKLQKDYLMNFVGLELCPYDSIIPYLQEDKLSDEAMNCLAKLHSVLELAVLCWTYLGLPQLTLNSIVRSSLKHYMTVPRVDPSHIFRFPVCMLLVKKAVERREPTEWQVSFVTKRNNGYSKQSVMHLATYPFLQPEFGKKRIPGSPQTIGNLYYYTTALLIEDDFPVMIKYPSSLP